MASPLNRHTTVNTMSTSSRKPLFEISDGHRLATVPALFLIGCFTLVAVMYWLSKEQQKSAAAINLAGRQRSLNLEHLNRVLRSGTGQPADYQATRNLLHESLAILRDGGEHDFGYIIHEQRPEYTTALAASEDLFDRTVQLSDQYLQATESDQEQADQLFSELIPLAEQSRQAAHRVVTTLADLSARDTQVGLTMAVVMAILIGVVAGIWAVYCAKRLTRRVGKVAKGLEHLAFVELNQVSDQLNDSATSTNQQASSAATAAEQVQGNVRSVSEAVNQFEISIREISENVSKAVSIAREANIKTETTDRTIRRLNDNSNSISEVVQAINSVAEQTNLLALNATIEAARAGEAGKGFAVVANEVKELAKQTTKATEDIVAQIETIRSDTGDAVGDIAVVQQVIAQINESQDAIAVAIEEQTRMTEGISRDIREVSNGTSEIVHNVANVADAAETTSQSSKETRQKAELIFSTATRLLEIVGMKSQASSGHAV